MTRRGKIARLPKGIRDELNGRLQNGEAGRLAVEWLNSLPETHKVVTEEFGGNAVTEQNLSDWRMGGYRDWEREQSVRKALGQAEDLDGVGAKKLSQGMATVITAEAAKALEDVLRAEDSAYAKAGWEQIGNLLEMAARLRQEERKASWLTLEQSRREREDTERLKAEWKKKLTDPIWARMNVHAKADGFGGGQAGLALAAYMEEVQRELPVGSLGYGPDEEKKGKGGGDPIEEHLKRQMRRMQEKGLKLEDMAGG